MNKKTIESELRMFRIVAWGLILGALSAVVLMLIQSEKFVLSPSCHAMYSPKRETVVVVDLVKAERYLRGIASHYNSAGCIGCSKDLIMANGEKLVDAAYTVALTPDVVRRYKLLNQFVTVRNMVNGKSVQAKVTDTGGFAKYNRVADLTDGTRDAIGCTGLCEITINF